MIVPTANKRDPAANAEPHGAEKNIFPDEQGDDAGHVNNDPRANKQRQNNQPRRGPARRSWLVVLDKPIA